MPAYSYYVNPYQQMPQTYQPVMQSPVQPQATYASPVPQSFSPVVQQSSIIWVSGEREAQMYPVAPNNAVTLWSQTEPVVYLKQADATGKPTLKVYDLVERTETQTPGTDRPETAVDEYAKKSDLSAVVSAISGIDGMIESLRSDVDTIKGDMYGIAGKKKTAKKVNDDDDE